MSDTVAQLNNEELTEEQISQLLEYIKSKTGMIFASRLKAWVIKQFEIVFNASKGGSQEMFLKALIGGRKETEARALFESLTVHETMFYRDKKYFNFMEKFMFPELIKANHISKSLNVWIAAGSSGQEAYSILFTLLDSFPELKTWNLKIYSTDLSAQIVEKAKKGIYESHEIGRGMDDEGLTRFFDKIDDKHWQVKKDYRDRVNFSPSNLVADFSTDVPNVDFISCRNVLIYFNDETKADIITRLAKKVNKNGYMLLGQVDYINVKVPPEGYEYKMLETFPYYKKA